MKWVIVCGVMFSFSIKIDNAGAEETTVSNIDSTTFSEIVSQEILEYDDNATETTSISNLPLFSETSITDPETVNSYSEKTPSQTTTSLPSNLSTHPPATVSPKNDRRTSEFCSCDVTGSYCDVNCCCDTDCDEDDRKAFNFCSSEPVSRLETSLCFSRQFIYSNNTRFSAQEAEKGLFCIAKDNFPERIHFSDQKVIDSPAKFNQVWHRKQHYAWTFRSRQPEDTFSSDLPYIYGTPVWSYFNSTNKMIPLVIPCTGPLQFCKSTRIVRFLENVESRCLRNIKTQDDCEFFLTNDKLLDSLTLVTSPLILNASKTENVTGLFFVNVRLSTCQNEYNCQTISILPSPEFNKTALTCSNVPKRLHLSIFHNGTGGIVDAELKVFEGSVVLHHATTGFEQIIRVTFEWARDRNVSVTRRSGTPGYLEGRPVLTNSRESVKYDERVDLFSLPKANFRGECSEDRNVVNFKHNMKTQCDLKFQNLSLASENSAKRIQDEIWRSLFENVQINSTDSSRLQLYISTFGDPEQFKSYDWVPVHLENFKTYTPGSLSFSTGVSLTIVYAMIGPFTNPQAKIIGAVARMFDARRLVCFFESRESVCSVKITASVNFVDSSKKAVSKFAKAPVVKIRLPKDFFYPFSSKSCALRGDFVKIVWIFNVFARIILL